MAPKPKERPSTAIGEPMQRVLLDYTLKVLAYKMLKTLNKPN